MNILEYSCLQSSSPTMFPDTRDFLGKMNGCSDGSRNCCLQPFSVAQTSAYQRVNMDVVEFLLHQFSQAETKLPRISSLNGSRLV